MKPRRFGRYELLDELGKGGMATILLARLVGPSDFQKHLVIKRIHDRLVKDPEVVNRFLDEARLAARIQHPNLVQIFEFDKQDGAYFIAMEYVHGQTVADLYNEVRHAPECGYHWGHAVRVVADAAAGLHAAHELQGAPGASLNLVHRDVSPQNILVSYDGHVKVTDFGIVSAIGRIHDTVDGTVMGKVAYMSPEQCRGEHVDRRTDVFALGIVLYEMVCLRRLFRRQSDHETMAAVLSCAVPPPRIMRPDLPAGLEEILQRALASDPASRYQTAADLQYALEGLLAGQGAMVTAGSVAALMNAVFQRQKQDRDRLIQRIYNKTFMEPPAPTPDTINAAATEVAAWDESAGPTDPDTAPPPVAKARGPFARTVQGFGTPAEAPRGPAPQAELSWDEANAVAEGPGVSRDAATVLEHTGAPSGAAAVWPPGAEPGTGATKPVRPVASAPQRAASYRGPTVDLNSSAPVAPAAAPASRPAGAGFAVSPAVGPLPARAAPRAPRPMAPPADPGSPLSRSGAVAGSGSPVSIGVIGLVLVGLIVFLATRGSKPDRPDKQRPKAQPTPTATASSVDWVTLTFEVAPATAKLLLDGKEPEGQRGAARRVFRLQWQDKAIEVRVTAKGHVPQTRAVIPEQDQTVRIKLDPVAAARKAPRKAPRRGRFRRRRPRAAPRARPAPRRRSRWSGGVLKDPFADPSRRGRPTPRRRAPMRGGGASAVDL